MVRSVLTNAMFEMPLLTFARNHWLARGVKTTFTASVWPINSSHSFFSIQPWSQIYFSSNDCTPQITEIRVFTNSADLKPFAIAIAKRLARPIS